MAQISRTIVLEFARQHTELTKSSAGMLERLLARIDERDREAISEAMRLVGSSYTEMSAALAANFYDAIRKQHRLSTQYRAVARSGFDVGKMQAATNAVLDEVEQGRNTVAQEKLLADVIGRYMKDAQEHSIKENALRDPAKPKYAIVPNNDACAFCVMRASNGYHYPRISSVKSHNGCTCTPTPVFGDDTVEGYDPNEYLDKYTEALRALDSGNISEELREKIKRNIELKGDKFDKTKQVLMVMREQQGIS